MSVRPSSLISTPIKRFRPGPRRKRAGRMIGAHRELIRRAHLACRVHLRGSGIWLLACLDHRRNPRRPVCCVVWRTTGRASASPDLAFAQGGRAMVRASRGGARRRPAGPAPTLLEPGPTSGYPWAAPSFLQGRAEPSALEGHARRLGRWRAHLVDAPAFAARHPRADQEQAGRPR